ncbi:hypothetical protein FHU30_004766 [Actinomadura rupiterrae]|nr:hypothetical protein [Actinomadura rupiterrae]
MGALTRRCPAGVPPLRKGRPAPVRVAPRARCARAPSRGTDVQCRVSAVQGRPPRPGALRGYRSGRRTFCASGWQRGRRAARVRHLVGRRLCRTSAARWAVYAAGACGCHPARRTFCAAWVRVEGTARRTGCAGAVLQGGGLVPRGCCAAEVLSGGVLCGGWVLLVEGALVGQGWTVFGLGWCGAFSERRWGMGWEIDGLVSGCGGWGGLVGVGVFRLGRGLVEVGRGWVLSRGCTRIRSRGARGSP